MEKEPRYLFSDVKIPDPYRPDVKSIVLFGLQCSDGSTVYLEIRYIDYENDVVEGDHLMLSLEESYEYAIRDYGIQKSDWRDLTSQEIEKIGREIK